MSQERRVDLSDEKMIGKEGNFIAPKEAPNPTHIRLHHFHDTVYEETTIKTLSELSLLNKKKHQYWIDVVGLKEKEHITSLCETLKLHPLAIEDILHTKQRTKIDAYDDHILFIIKIIPLPERVYREPEQMSIIIKNNMIITFRETQKLSFAPIHQHLKKGNSDPKLQSNSYLLYLFIDTIVDNYFNICERLETVLGTFENVITDKPEEINVKYFYHLRKKLTQLKKIVRQLYDCTDILLHESLPIIDKAHHFYYRDLFDHAARLVDEVDIYLDLSHNLLEMYMSNLNHTMNHTMRILTIFASIFIPLTFISSLYGMNFIYIPGVQNTYGYFIMLGIMFFIMIVGFTYFKRKKWL